jgi:TonB family protein
MKKLLLTTVISLILTFSISAQTGNTAEQTKALNEIGSLNGKVIALYNQKKYDEALKPALDVWTVAEKNGLSKDLRVLPFMTNLPEIYLVQGKESEAIAAFQKILEGYQSNSSDTRQPVVKITERIGTAYFVKKDYSKAEEFFLRALLLREQLNGASSKETASVSTALGNTYRLRKNYDKAAEFFLKAIEINDKVLSKAEKKDREDLLNYECFVYHKALAQKKLKEASREIKEFRDARKDDNEKGRPFESGIVNGRAINLVKPSFPINMRGNEGFVLVRVTIDEQGNVISAKATCGILEFVATVEEAARKSKFSPTMINNQPVKVTGIIVYNFIR